VAQIYKSADVKKEFAVITDQLKMIDFDKEAPWLKTAKALDLTFQVTFSANFFKRDLDNTIKTFQDAIFKHLGLNDSKVVSLHGWKTIMPGAQEELICVKLKESSFQYMIQGNTEQEEPKRKKRPRIFLGGTIGTDNWRGDLEKLLKKEKINSFNPVVSDWSLDRIAIEEDEKDNKCDFLLYVITHEMKGAYSLAEVVDSAYKSKMGTDKKVLLYIDTIGFTEVELKSLEATIMLVQRIGEKNIRAAIREGKDDMIGIIKEMLDIK
jgi:Holliday junction resolvase RusA-like endonuclease